MILKNASPIYSFTQSAKLLGIYVFVFVLLGNTLLLSAQTNMTFIGNLDYEQPVNDIWGYAAPDGTEYALVGTQTGVSVVSLLDPENPEELFFVEGTETTWRDMKTWESMAYSVCDNCPDGLLVMDLSDLPNSMPHYFWNDIPDSTFQSAHNIFVDEFGYGYLCGTNLDGGQTIYLDLFSNNGAPEFVDYGPSNYAHDIYVRDNLMYASEIYVGLIAVYDVSDKSNSILLGNQETPSNFTHNAWLSDDSKTVFTTDEKAFGSTAAYDVSDFSDIKFLDQFYSEASIGQATIPHNVHVLNDYLVISHYTDGVVVVDAQYPDNLVEVGNYDTYPNPDVGFNGCWGAYPFLPSGNVLATDRQTGLYVLSPDYKRASYLHGNVSDAETGANLNEVAITITEANRSTTTDGFGNFKTGIPESGIYNLFFHKKFYEDKTIAVEFNNNEITTINVTMDPAQSFTLNGQVVDAKTNAGIANAKVRFESDFYQYETTADANGNYTVEDFYPDEYMVAAGRWGYKSVLQNNELLSGTFSIVLAQGFEDNFLIDLGWKVSGDAVQGEWVREVPVGALIVSNSVPAVYLSPNADVPEDPGNYCYVTGNDGPVRDVELTGFTRLTSPPIDMEFWNNPKVSFYSWFSSIRGPFISTPNGAGGLFDFKIYNGRDTVLLDQWNGDTFLVFPEWLFTEYKILDYIAATDQMQFIFEATGGAPENAFDEAAIDFFRAWDDNADGSQDLHVFEVSVYPNPFRGNFTVDYNIGSLEDAELRIYDSLGKELLYYELETTRGPLEIGERLMAGIYFLEFRCGGEKEVLILVSQ